MEKNLRIDNLDIHVVETGKESGSPVIILHGWGCNTDTVKSIAQCLEDECRVVRVDLPGHGKSDEPNDIWHTSDFADLVHKVARELGISSPSLIGHSFGGRTSISYASKYPVEKLVLVDSAGITPKRSLKYYYKVYSYKALKKSALFLLGEKRGSRFIEKAIKKRGSADYQNASPRMRAIMSKCVNEDLRKIMPEIKAPTLLIWGENDTATPVTDAKIMEKNISDSGLVCFPNCGHYSFLDNPWGFRAVIRSFFNLKN